MATKKKTKKKKISTPKKNAGKKTALKKTATKKARKRSLKSAKSGTAAENKKKITQKNKTSAKKQIRKKPASSGIAQFSRQGQGSRSGEQSGDLQGLSRAESADSESVDELLEEGNAFEADAVKGVEDAGRAEGREVHTHEVPEDDVPGEYLDEE